MRHHISSEFSTPETNVATPEYSALIEEVSAGMILHRPDIVYIPYAPEQRNAHVKGVTYADRDSHTLTTLMETTDALICISRDEDPNPDYSDSDPRYNTTLTPSGASNVDTAVDLYKRGQAAGNEQLKFIATGRMHNRSIRAMLARPDLLWHISTPEEKEADGFDIHNIPDQTFESRIRRFFTSEHYQNMELESDFSGDTAILSLLEEAGWDNMDTPTPEDLQRAADTIVEEYQSYPRVSTSRLMVERAEHLGVSGTVIREDDWAVDTITNLINTTKLLYKEDADVSQPRRVVIVAGSDHLPRTMWIANHILPDNIEIVCVESAPRLSSEAYSQSCARELASWRKGSKWIGGTRDLGALTEITYQGYFSPKRKNTASLAREVAAEGTLGHTVLQGTLPQSSVEK